MSMKDSVERYYSAKKNVEENNLTMKQEAENIIGLMQKKNRNNFSIKIETDTMNETMLKFTKVTTKKIVWNIKKLKQKLRKEICDEVVEKTYYITDMKSLVVYLKECGVSAKEFKKYIDVQERVNEKKIDNLSEIGKIGREDIEGCYDITLGKPYIRMSVNNKLV